MDNTHHDVNLVFRPEEARPLNLPPFNSAADLAAGTPILTRIGRT